MESMRSFFSVLRSTTRRPTGTIIEPPIPCRTRAAVNCHRRELKPQSMEESVNMAMARQNIVRAPKRSAIHPLMGMKTASVSM